MGVEFQQKIVKALKLNQECKNAGLGNRCFAVIMTALTGSEEFGIHWIREINEKRGLPPFINNVLPKAEFREAASAGPGENLPLKNIKAILEDPKGVIRESEPTNWRLISRPVEGTLIIFEPREKRANLIGNEKRQGHIALVVPDHKLIRESRLKLKDTEPQKYYVVDTAVEGGAVLATPEEIMKGLQNMAPNYTSRLSIIVRV